MKYVIAMATILLAFSATANAGGRYHSGSCGAEFSINGSTGNTNGLNGYSDSIVSDKFSRERTDFIGFTLSFPLGGQDCDYVESQAAAQRAEADRLRQIAIEQKLKNLQLLIVTCRTEKLPVCTQIDQMSREIFN